MSRHAKNVASIFTLHPIESMNACYYVTRLTNLVQHSDKVLTISGKYQRARNSREKFTTDKIFVPMKKFRQFCLIFD